MSRRPLDLAAWPRREHFEYFRGFDKPFFNLCAELDVTALVELARRRPEVSFTAGSLFLSLQAANAVEAMRYRLAGDSVEVYDHLHGAVTVMRDDGTFGFAYYDFLEDFGAFRRGLEAEIERVKTTRGLDDRPQQQGVLHHSVIPWVRFTSFSHARRHGTSDSIPKVVFGRRSRDGERWGMPVSIEAHHALADGRDVGQVFQHFEEALLEPAAALGLG